MVRLSPIIGASSALLFASSAAAFRDTSPLLAWSSTPNEALNEASSEVTTGAIAADAVFGSLPSVGCDWDVVMVVHMDELHQSHVAGLTLPYESSKADLHIPFLVRPERKSLDTSVEDWAKQCGAELVDEYTPSVTGGRTFVYYNAEHGDVALPSGLPEKHLVVLVGTRDLTKRQFDEEIPFEAENEAEEEVATEAPVKVAAPGNGTTAPGNGTDGSYPDYFDIFTTPLITALLVSFGLLLPILLFGIYSLAGIQVPPRMMEIGKSLSVNKDRKDQ